jgi:hypothetical protein
MTVSPPSPTPAKPFKAVASGIGTFIIALWFQVNERRESLDTLNTNEWILTFLAAAAMSAIVWGVPNPAKRP